MDANRHPALQARPVRFAVRRSIRKRRLPSCPRRCWPQELIWVAARSASITMAVEHRLGRDIARKGVLFGSLDSSSPNMAICCGPISSDASSTQTTTNLPPSMRPAGAAGRCSTCRRASRSKPRSMPSRPCPTAVSILAKCSSILEEGAEATLLCETASSVEQRQWHALWIHRADRRAGCQTPICEPPKLGPSSLAFRPPAGGRRSRRAIAVDDRRAGCSACQRSTSGWR